MTTAEAWGTRADELAAWAWGHLINRHDAWGRYGDAGTYTAPAVRLRGQVFLTVADVARHFRARGRDDILGAHTTAPDNRCRWVAPDIDHHGDGGNDPGANLAAAIAWHDRAKVLGFRPVLATSNGTGGYHLRIFFREPIAAPRAFSFVRWLVRDHTRHGIPTAPECFPKQPTVTASGAGSYGNWLRLPGRHHKRDYWSQVWDGGRWLDGAEAVAWLLAVRGDNPGLIPREAEPKPPAPLRRRTLPTQYAGGIERRIAAYIAKVPNSGEGTGRDDRGFQLAAWLVRDLNLDDATARPWLEQWDSGNSPPKGEAQITKWLADARAYGRREYGCGLTSTGRATP